MSRDHTKTHRWLKWFWVTNLPLVTGLYFLLMKEPLGPENLLLLYLAWISVYANVAGHWAGEEAAPESEEDDEDDGGDDDDADPVEG